MKTYDERERIERGQKAKLILENPVYAEGVQFLRDALVREWLATRSPDEEERERIWALRQMLERLNAYFENVAKTGELTAKNIASEPNRRRFGVI